MTLHVALVAGGSRGLGLLICRDLLARGFTVVGCARDAEELADAEAQLAAPGRFTTRACDIRDAAAVATLVDEVTAEHGDIEVAVTVAGIIQAGPAESMTLDHFRDAVDTMLWGPVTWRGPCCPGCEGAAPGASAPSRPSAGWSPHRT